MIYTTAYNALRYLIICRSLTNLTKAAKSRFSFSMREHAAPLLKNPTNPAHAYNPSLCRQCQFITILHRELVIFAPSFLSQPSFSRHRPPDPISFESLKNLRLMCPQPAQRSLTFDTSWTQKVRSFHSSTSRAFVQGCDVLQCFACQKSLTCLPVRGLLFGDSS